MKSWANDDLMCPRTLPRLSSAGWSLGDDGEYPVMAIHPPYLSADCPVCAKEITSAMMIAQRRRQQEREEERMFNRRDERAMSAPIASCVRIYQPFCPHCGATLSIVCHV